MHPWRPHPERGTIVLVIEGRIARSGIPGLCERVRDVLEGCGEELVVCDVGGILDPDVATVDALARVQLTARRMGRRIRLLHACWELTDLVDLMGLAGVVRTELALPLEAQRQAEQREQRVGVEEERDPADPTA